MRILAIESSCDESSVAFAEAEGDGTFTVLSELTTTQAVHVEYGGVVPELASREHITQLTWMIRETEKASGIKLKDLDLVGVTAGPGLLGCLLVGTGFASGIATSINKPLLPLNHLEGHLFSPFIGSLDIKYPFIGVIVSGGHTEIVLVEGLGQYQYIARTQDDAAGEAFDKTAALLGLPYPGGKILSELADSVSESRFKLPRVNVGDDTFSFSGLKTAIRLLIQKSDPALYPEICFAVQEAISEELVRRVEKACRRFNVFRVAVSGGVSANRKLREKLNALKGGEVFFPEMRYCGDNATMIAFLGALYSKENDFKIDESALTFETRARWPLAES